MKPRQLAKEIQYIMHCCTSTLLEGDEYTFMCGSIQHPMWALLHMDCGRTECRGTAANWRRRKWLSVCSSHSHKQLIGTFPFTTQYARHTSKIWKTNEKFHSCATCWVRKWTTQKNNILRTVVLDRNQLCSRFSIKTAKGKWFWSKSASIKLCQNRNILNRLVGELRSAQQVYDTWRSNDMINDETR